MKYYLLSDLIYQQAAVLGDKEVIRSRDKKSGTWAGITWNQFAANVQKLAEVLIEWNVNEQDRIGVYSPNKEECFTIDFAVFSIRAASVPMYATSSVSQIQYIIDESEISLLFVGEQFQYDNAFQILSQNKVLKQLVVLDEEVVLHEDDKTSVYFRDFTSRKTNASEEVSRRRKAVREEDIATIVYTSGTTGEPKGVVLTQGNYKEALIIHDLRLSYLPKDGLSMCFLPLTHIFEKAWSIYCLHRGDVLAVNLDPKEIQKTIMEVKPTAMCSVPRFWEKVYAGVQEKIETSKPLTKKILLDAIKTGNRYVLQFRNKGKKAPFCLRLKFKFYDKTIYSLLKKVVGIERGIIYPCAGAPLSDKINEFIQSVNIPLVYGYGLSETTATVCCFPHTGFVLGSVGKVMPRVEVKIGENDEILVKGKTVMKEYYKKPEATAAAFTSDGWLKTGDAGRLSENGDITLTDRIKDLYKTSNGKYIAPQQIEMRLSADKYIDNIAVIGDQRKYVTALIVPNFSELKAYAEEKGMLYNDVEELCNHPAIYGLYKLRIDPLQKELANYEQIKYITILPRPFTMETGELTNTMKIRRAFVLEKFSKEIESMYPTDN